MRSPRPGLSIFLMALAMLAETFSPVFALPLESAPSSIYVSPAGSDLNAGSSAAPVRSLSRAASLLMPGSTLMLLPGVYHEQLILARSGTPSAPIRIQAAGAVLDMRGASRPGLEIRASYVTVSGLEVTNSSDICVNVVDDYVTVENLTVHECWSHGIHVSAAAHVNVLYNTVYRTVLQNAARTMASGWASAIKVRESTDVLVQGNTIYNNYGEGMGTRASNITIRGNVVFDNYSVNIYTNSENATIEKNFVFCTANSEFYRGGKPGGGIVMAEEYFDGWGARLKNARIINNIVAYCKNGVRYDGADPTLLNAGLKSGTILHNTLFATVEAPLSIMYASAQSGNLVANNILWQANNNLASIQSGVGITFSHNLWRTLPPAVAQGPGDRYGDPGFLVNSPGYTPTDYRLSSASPAAGAALDLNLPDDYFGASRSSTLDIGAIRITPIFADVASSHPFRSYIEAFYRAGLTSGCNTDPLRFCPDATVTRAEMGVFLLRARHGVFYQPPASTGLFEDLPVDGQEWMQPWIEQFYREGTTSGCSMGPLRYCPLSNVSRAEMAVFILKARHGAGYQPPAPTGIFADVPVAGKEWMQPWIEQFYREGITSGCSPNSLSYCPENKVTRAEMAVFITRAFGIP